MVTSTRRPESVLYTPGMRTLIGTTSLGFAGYSLLLPTAPLWAAHGGANEAGAGLVNAVLMLATITFQTLVPWTLRRVGWRTTLVAGVLLLGLPSLALAADDALAWVLGWSAVRGVGFAVVTVCGASAVAQLVDAARHGRAIGLYGLAIAAPQFVLLPFSSWIAESIDFRVVFIAGAAPVLAVPFALALGTRLDRLPPTIAPTSTERTPAPGARLRTLLALVLPSVVLLAVTTPGGALLTFAPQFPYGPAVITAGLMAFTGTAAVGRWLVGRPADRHGPWPFLPPLLALAVLGLGLCAWAVADGGRMLALLTGMVCVGVAYGSIQNLTLVVAFAAVPREQSSTASAVWNIGFDAGTGLGALVVGLIAARTSFTTGLLTTAVICAAVALLTVTRARGSRVRPTTVR